MTSMDGLGLQAFRYCQRAIAAWLVLAALAVVASPLAASESNGKKGGIPAVGTVTGPGSQHRKIATPHPKASSHPKAKPAMPKAVPKAIVPAGEGLHPRVGLIAVYVDAVEASAKADARLAAIDRDIQNLEAGPKNGAKLKVLRSEHAALAATRDSLMQTQRDILDVTANRPVSDEQLSAIHAILGMEGASQLIGLGSPGKAGVAGVKPAPKP